MSNEKIIYVHTGEVKTSANGTVLKSSPIGSCIAIAAFDPLGQIGAMAHFMLPGKAPVDKDYEKAKYASNALKELITGMGMLGANKKNIEVCIVGGANVMKRKDNTIADENIVSALSLLQKRHIKIRARSIGGTKRRSVSLNMESGRVSYTVGDGDEKLLYQFMDDRRGTSG